MDVGGKEECMGDEEGVLLVSVGTMSPTRGLTVAVKGSSEGPMDGDRLGTSVAGARVVIVGTSVGAGLGHEVGTVVGRDVGDAVVGRDVGV